LAEPFNLLQDIPAQRSATIRPSLYSLWEYPVIEPDPAPLYGLKKFSTTIAMDINDLSTTSPHARDSDNMQKI
jgi:hypothetical protein